MKKIAKMLGIAAISAGSLVVASPSEAINLTETRSETDLFQGQSQIPNNTFSFNIPSLISNVIRFDFSWVDLDTSPTEAFDVRLIDQLGNSQLVFNGAGTDNSSGTTDESASFSRNINLSSSSAGTLSFVVSQDTPFDTGGTGFFLPEGSMTLSISDENLLPGDGVVMSSNGVLKDVPEPLTILGTGVAFGFGTLLKKRKSA